MPFPMAATVLDAFIILTLVTGLSLLASLLPVKYLLKKNFESILF